ncbi:MAG: conjugal transfer protein TraX [Lachnospiraceae bacterium]|nr:conjugal transfer protein TraX [Lachnospiraceae bacterium]
MEIGEKKLQCLSGSTLKLIAMASMLIDHTAAFFLLYARPLYHHGTEAFPHAELVYQVMRQIGRTAFPIFCFLLVEGFYHTSDRFRYLARLMVFALLSELPFDLATQGRIVGWKYQNVFFTLCLGMGMMMLLSVVADAPKTENGQRMMPALRLVLCACICLFFLWAAEAIRCDYGSRGILLILILYWLRPYRALACAAGYVSFLWEAFCFPAFLLIPLYNGKRGIRLKYVFYAFYPVHILLLYFLKTRVF